MAYTGCTKKNILKIYRLPSRISYDNSQFEVVKYSSHLIQFLGKTVVHKFWEGLDLWVYLLGEREGGSHPEQHNTYSLCISYSSILFILKEIKKPEVVKLEFFQITFSEGILLIPCLILKAGAGLDLDLSPCLTFFI